jgi:hypothetical protein
MANIGLVSPGVKVREVDLTVGRIDALSDQTGAICGPFSQGPVLEPILIENEQELLNIFGKPISSDRQYEYWYSASNYLQYGGVLRVARTDGANLRNANVGAVGVASTSTLKIKSYEDYKNNYETTSSYRFAARNPGAWANGLKVAVIDGAADQRLTVGAAATASLQVGYAVTQATTSVVAGVGTTSVNDGYLQGIITGIGVSTIDVKVVNRVSAAGSVFPVSYTEGGAYAFTSGTATNVGFGTTSTPGSGLAFLSSSSTIASPSAGLQTSATLTSANVSDWYGSQFIQLDNGQVLWRSIAEKPGTSGYAAARNSKNDEIHVVVIDDKGSISGNAGTILEKHAFLSKAKDNVNSLGSKVYYKDYVADNSNYLFVGVATGNGSIASGIQTAFTATSTNSVWGTDTQDVTFNVVGNQLYTLAAGKDYSGTNNEGGYSTTLGDIVGAYELFENEAEYAVNFLINGPGVASNKEQSHCDCRTQKGLSRCCIST